MKCKLLWIGVMAVAAFVLPVGLVNAQNVVVFDEDFSDDDAGGWKDNSGHVPASNGKAGTWVMDNYTEANGTTAYDDSDWSPLVQGQVGAAGGSGAPSLDLMFSLNRTGADTGSTGVFNMGGIQKFTKADGTPRPAVTGDKIVGSFRAHRQSGSMGFGFTDNIAEYQAFQATMPKWKTDTHGSSPISFPTPYTSGGWEDPAKNSNYDANYRGFSPNVTGYIGLLSGSNGVNTAAAVDMDDNGVVDFGRAAPKSEAHLASGLVSFELTVGNSDYDLLQIDGVDVLQCNTAACQDTGGSPTTLNPGGPMPVGKVLGSVEAMFMTVGNHQLSEFWVDDIHIEIVPIPEPTSAVLLLLGVVGACIRRQRS